MTKKQTARKATGTKTAKAASDAERVFGKRLQAMHVVAHASEIALDVILGPLAQTDQSLTQAIETTKPDHPNRSGRSN